MKQIKKPNLTIIIPTYNVAKFVEKAIESVLRDDIELIIIDDESEDGTLEIVSKYKKFSNVKLIKQKHSGLGAARNNAVKLAKGDYLMFLDGDDYISDKALDFLFLAMTEEPDLIIFQWQLVSEAGDIISLANGTKYLDGMWLACWNKCYKKSIYSNMLFPENVIYEDVGYAITAYIEASKRIFIERPLIFHRNRAHSLSRSPIGLRTRLDVLSGFEQLYNNNLGQHRKVIDRITVRTILTHVKKGIYEDGYIDKLALKEMRMFILHHGLMRFHRSLRLGVWQNLRQNLFLYLICMNQIFLLKKMICR